MTEGTRRLIFWSQSVTFNERTAKDILEKLKPWTPQVLIWSSKDTKSKDIRKVKDCMIERNYWKGDPEVDNTTSDTEGRWVQNAELEKLFTSVIPTYGNGCETIMVLGSYRDQFIQNTIELTKKTLGEDPNSVFRDQTPFVAVLESNEDSWDHDQTLNSTGRWHLVYPDHGRSQ